MNSLSIDSKAFSRIYRVDADDIPSTSITNKCIVLDLDQTLIDTQDDVKSLKTFGILSNPQLMSLRKRVYYITIEDMEKPGIGTKYDFWGVTRPHIQEFLLFCFSYFKIVAVWSAGKRPYVEAIVDHIFKDIRPPHAIFTYDDVSIGPEGYVEKKLTKMFDSDPILKKNMSLQNTFVLDDTYMTFIFNDENGILIPAYQPASNIEALSRDDPTLLQLKYWLLLPEVVNTNDVRELNKEDIFSTSLTVYRDKLRNVPGYTFAG